MNFSLFKNVKATRWGCQANRLDLNRRLPGIFSVDGLEVQGLAVEAVVDTCRLFHQTEEVLAYKRRREYGFC